MKHFLALLALTAPLLGSAQPLPQAAPLALQSQGAAPPPPYVPMAATGVSGLVSEGTDWKAANATVGQFARGHMDIVAWEKAQAAAPAPAPATQEPRR